MVEIDGVANTYSIGGGINNCVAAVVVEGRANSESIPCAEVPGIAWSGFVVDGDFVSDWAKRCGVLVTRNVVIFPC